MQPSATAGSMYILFTFRACSVQFNPAWSSMRLVMCAGVHKRGGYLDILCGALLVISAVLICQPKVVVRLSKARVGAHSSFIQQDCFIQLRVIQCMSGQSRLVCLKQPRRDAPCSSWSKHIQHQTQRVHLLDCLPVPW